MSKRVTILIFILFLTTGIAQGRGLEIQKMAGDYNVLVRLDRYPPVLGENPIEIEIKESQGIFITDAKVLINYYMPPMPRMAPMNYKTEAQLSRGKYKTNMNIIMSGPWVIRVLITRNGKTSLVKLNVDAQ
jgi:YtkA-like